MAELIDKWEVVSKLITLQNNYTFFKNEWDAERLYREIAKLEIGIGKTPGLQVVRCKECEFSKYFEESGTRKCRTQNGMYRTVTDDEYCAYGERKCNGT